MRVCYFNYEWDLETSTGAATQIAATRAGLERLGHEVVVVDRHRKPAGRAGGGRRRRGGGWLWETANHWRSIRGVQAETAILERLRPDVVLTLHALRFSSLLAARRCGLPVVLQVNASVPDETRRYHPDVHLLPGFSNWVERRMLRAADGVIAVSSGLRDWLVRQGVEAERITVVPNGTDATRFRPEAADREFRARFGGCTLVGFIGSFARYHGTDMLELAVREVPALYPTTHFVFVGAGLGADELRNRCRAAGTDHSVTWLGYVPREGVPAIAASMDVLLAPYPQEFFYFSPIKMFEYMASGRAVLASRLGQVAEVIDDGRNGLLYEPANRRDFLAKLLLLLRDPDLRARLGAEARRTILAGYTWDHNGRLVEQALEKARQATSFALRPSSRPAAACR